MYKDTKIDELRVRVPDLCDSKEKDTINHDLMNELRRRAARFYRGESVGEDWRVVMDRVFERLRAEQQSEDVEAKGLDVEDTCQDSHRLTK